MKISDEMIEQIKVFEGCRLDAYLDSAGIPTIGIGHTGKDVTMGDRISNEEATRLFRQDVRSAENAVNKFNTILLEKTRGYGGFTQQQFDAMVSIVYNCGAGCIRTDTTLYKVIMGGGRNRYPDVCHGFMLWTKITNPKTGKKEVLQGLVNRRAMEAAWYVYGKDWKNELIRHGIKDVVEWAKS